MNQLSALEIKLVDNFFDKEALIFLKETSYLQYVQGVDGLFFSAFLPFFLKKELRNAEQDGATRNKAPGF